MRLQQSAGPEMGVKWEKIHARVPSFLSQSYKGCFHCRIRAENVASWGGTALVSGSFEVLIGEQPQKAELISNLEL